MTRKNGLTGLLYAFILSLYLIINTQIANAATEKGKVIIFSNIPAAVNLVDITPATWTPFYTSKYITKYSDISDASILNTVNQSSIITSQMAKDTFLFHTEYASRLKSVTRANLCGTQSPLDSKNFPSGTNSNVSTVTNTGNEYRATFPNGIILDTTFFNEYIPEYSQSDPCYLVMYYEFYKDSIGIMKFTGRNYIKNTDNNSTKGIESSIYYDDDTPPNGFDNTSPTTDVLFGNTYEPGYIDFSTSTLQGSIGNIGSLFDSIQSSDFRCETSTTQSAMICVVVYDSVMYPNFDDLSFDIPITYEVKRPGSTQTYKYVANRQIKLDGINLNDPNTNIDLSGCNITSTENFDINCLTNKSWVTTNDLSIEIPVNTLSLTFSNEENGIGVINYPDSKNINVITQGGVAPYKVRLSSNILKYTQGNESILSASIFGRTPKIFELIISAFKNIMTNIFGLGKADAANGINPDPNSCYSDQTYNQFTNGGILFNCNYIVDETKLNGSSEYYITFTVTDLLGQTISKNVKVIIPKTGLTISPSTSIVAKGTKVSLAGSGGSGDSSKYEWAITDGSIDTCSSTVKAKNGVRTILIDTSCTSSYSIGVTLKDTLTRDETYASIDISQATPVGLIISHSVCTSTVDGITWRFPNAQPDWSNITWGNIRWSSTPPLDFSEIINVDSEEIIPLCAYALLSDNTIQNISQITNFYAHNATAGEIQGSSIKILKGGSNIITASIDTVPFSSGTGTGGTVTVRSLNAVNITSNDLLKITPANGMIRKRPTTTIGDFNTDLSPLSVQELVVTGGKDSDLFIWSVPSNESGGCLLKGRFSQFQQTPTTGTGNPFPCYDSLSILGSETRYVSYVGGTQLGTDKVEVINTNITPVSNSLGLPSAIFNPLLGNEYWENLPSFSNWSTDSRRKFDSFLIKEPNVNILSHLENGWNGLRYIQDGLFAVFTNYDPGFATANNMNEDRGDYSNDFNNHTLKYSYNLGTIPPDQKYITKSFYLHAHGATRTVNGSITSEPYGITRLGIKSIDILSGLSDSEVYISGISANIFADDTAFPDYESPIKIDLVFHPQRYLAANTPIAKIVFTDRARCGEDWNTVMNAFVGSGPYDYTATNKCKYKNYELIVRGSSAGKYQQFQGTLNASSGSTNTQAPFLSITNGQNTNLPYIGNGIFEYLHDGNLSKYENITIKNTIDRNYTFIIDYDPEIVRDVSTSNSSFNTFNFRLNLERPHYNNETIYIPIQLKDSDNIQYKYYLKVRSTSPYSSYDLGRTLSSASTDIQVLESSIDSFDIEYTNPIGSSTSCDQNTSAIFPYGSNIGFCATAKTQNGSTLDITRSIKWISTNSSVGTFDTDSNNLKLLSQSGSTTISAIYEQTGQSISSSNTISITSGNALTLSPKTSVAIPRSNSLPVSTTTISNLPNSTINLSVTGTINGPYTLTIDGTSNGCFVSGPSETISSCVNNKSITVANGSASPSSIYYLAGTRAGEDKIILKNGLLETEVANVVVQESEVEEIELYALPKTGISSCDDSSISNQIQLTDVTDRFITESVTFCVSGKKLSDSGSGASNLVNLTPLVEWVPTNPLIGSFDQGHLKIETDTEALVTAKYTLGDKIFVSNSVRIKPIPKLEIIPGDVLGSVDNTLSFGIKGGDPAKTNLFISIGGQLAGKLEGNTSGIFDTTSKNLNVNTWSNTTIIKYKASIIGTDQLMITDGYTSSIINIDILNQIPDNIYLFDSSCSTQSAVTQTLSPLSNYSYCVRNGNTVNNDIITDIIKFQSSNTNAGEFVGNTFVAKQPENDETTLITAYFETADNRIIRAQNSISLTVSGKLDFVSPNMTTVRLSSNNVTSSNTFELLTTKGALKIGDKLSVSGTSNGCLVNQTTQPTTKGNTCIQSLTISSTPSIFYIAGNNLGQDEITLRRGNEEVKMNVNVINQRPSNLTITTYTETSDIRPKFYIGESANIKVMGDDTTDYTSLVTLDVSNPAVASLAGFGLDFIGQGATTVSAVLVIGENDSISASTTVSSTNLEITPSNLNYFKRNTGSGTTLVSYPFSIGNPISPSNTESNYRWSLSGNGCLSTDPISTVPTTCNKTINSNDLVYFLPPTTEESITLTVQDLNRSISPATTTFQIIDSKPSSIEIGRINTTGQCSLIENNIISNLYIGDQVSLCATAKYEDESTTNVSPFVTWKPSIQDFGTFTTDGIFRITTTNESEASIVATYTSAGANPLVSNSILIKAVGAPKLNIDNVSLKTSEGNSSTNTFTFSIVNANKFPEGFEWTLTGSGGGSILGSKTGNTVIYQAGQRAGVDTIKATHKGGKGFALGNITLENASIKTLYISHNIPKPYYGTDGLLVKDSTGKNMLWSDSQCKAGLTSLVSPKNNSGITTNFLYSESGTGGTVSSIQVSFPISYTNLEIIKNFDSRSSFETRTGGATYKPGFKSNEVGRDMVLLLNNGKPVMRFWFEAKPAGTSGSSNLVNGTAGNATSDILDITFIQETLDNNSLIFPPKLEGMHVNDIIPLCASALMDNGQIVDLGNRVSWISSNTDAASFESNGSIKVINGGQTFLSAILDLGNGDIVSSINKIELVAFDKLEIVPNEQEVSTNSYLRLSVTGGYVGGDDFTYPDHPFAVSVAGSNTAACVTGKTGYENNTSGGNILFNSTNNSPYNNQSNLLDQLQNNIASDFLSNYSSSLLSQQSVALSECRSYIELADPRVLQDIYLYTGPTEGNLTVTISDGYSTAKSNITVTPRSYAYLAMAPSTENITTKSAILSNIIDYPTIKTYLTVNGKLRSLEPGDTFVLNLYGSDNPTNTQISKVYDAAVWQSSNPTAVQVDPTTGTINILDEGIATVTATLGTKVSAPLIIKVESKPQVDANKSVFNPSVISLGRTTTLSVFISDTKGSSDIELASADFSRIGIIPTEGSYKMTRGQEAGNGAWYNISVTIPTSTVPGVYSMEITARDISKNNSVPTKVNVPLIVIDKVLPGDINGDNKISMKDAVLALQISVGNQVNVPYNPLADINGDRRIGIAEAVYALRKVAGLL